MSEVLKPPEPCKNCLIEYRCRVKNEVFIKAIEYWLEDKVYECPSYSPEEHYERGCKIND